MAQLERLKTDLDLAGRHVFGPAAPSAATDLVRWQDIGSQTINLPPGAVAFGAASGGGITSDPNLTYDATTNHALKIRINDPHASAQVDGLIITSPNVTPIGFTAPLAFVGIALRDDADGNMLHITANKQTTAQQPFASLFVEGTLANSTSSPALSISGRAADGHSTFIAYVVDQDVHVGAFNGHGSDTSTTVGFFHFGGMLGAPTGTPVHKQAYKAALTYDINNHRMYVYESDSGPWNFSDFDNGALKTTVTAMAAAHVLTSQAEASFSNAVNLGALASGFLTQTVSGGVATLSIDASTYLTTSSAASTYETQSHASSTYLTITGAAATYETQSHASSTYQPILTAGTGIAIASNTVSAKLSTGVSGSQSVVGGTAASESLTLSSTTHGTKGRILCGSFFALDETNARVLIGTQTAGSGVPLTIASAVGGSTGQESIASTGNIVITGTSAGFYYAASSGTLEISNTNSGGGLSLRTNATRRWALNANGSMQFMSGPYVSFSSGSGITPSGATVAEWALTPPSIASASGAVLDGHKWDATTVTITGSTNITTATGFNWVTFEQPTFSAANALTITHAATVCIKGGPLNGGAGPAIFTNDYALWVQNDPARFDGFILAQGGISTNFGAHLNLSTPTTAQHINITAGAVTYLTADGSADMLALAQGTHSVLSIFSAGPDFHGGKRIVFLADRDALPTGDPSGGGYLYSDGGALKWRGSSGTITTIATA